MMHSKKYWFLQWLGRHSRVAYWLWRRWLLLVNYPFLPPPGVEGRHLRYLMTLVQPGDVLLRNFNWSPCYMLIPGKYGHSSIAVDNQNVVQALQDRDGGVRVDDLLDFAKNADRVAILRPPYKSDVMRRRAIQYAYEHLAAPYNTLFTFDEDSPPLGRSPFYCHELSWCCLWAGGITVPTTGDYVTGDDLLRHLPIVWEGGRGA